MAFLATLGVGFLDHSDGPAFNARMMIARIAALVVAVQLVTACGGGSSGAPASGSGSSVAAATDGGATAVSAGGAANPGSPSQLAQPPTTASGVLLPTPSAVDLASSPGDSASSGAADAAASAAVVPAPAVSADAGTSDGGAGAATAPPVPPAAATAAPPNAAAPTATPPTAIRHSIAGTIRVADTLDADSDTNDPGQSGWRGNDSLATAQWLTAPVLLTGYVNRPGTGPAGRTQASGDLDDVYRVNVTAGQVVEIEFNGDPPQTDLDLWIYALNGELRGSSVGAHSRYDCVQFKDGGDFHVNVRAYAGAANYLLRIGSPTTSQRCPNLTLAQPNVLPGELIVQARAGAGEPAGKAIDRLKSLGLQTVAGAVDGLWLVKLPAAAGDRQTVLKGLRSASTTVSAGTKSAVESAASSTAPATAPAARAAISAATVTPTSPFPTADDMSASLRAALPAATLELIDTLTAAKHLGASKDLLHASANGWNRSLQASSLELGPLPSNDAYYLMQAWNLELIGLPAAFSLLEKRLRQDDWRPVVAMIDTGVALDHPDLAQRLLRRLDGSVEGYDFVSNLANAGDGTGIDADPDETRALVSTETVSARFHGTHTAGIVAAQGFNALGITGVAPLSRLMPLRAMGAQGGSDFDVIQAIRYAAGLSNPSGRLPERRADVVNLSLGRVGSCSAALEEAVRSAREQGLTVVAAAGNEGHNASGVAGAVGSPANCAGVISVGAVDSKGQVTDYSNSGPGLSVVAPGGDLTGPVTASGYPDGVFSALAGFDSTGTRVPTYGYRDGTSMSAPHVSAVLALMKYVNPSLTPAQIDLLLSSGRLTRDLGQPGFDPGSGHGLIDAGRAVQAAIETVSQALPTQSLTLSPTRIAMGSMQTEAEFELRLSGTASSPGAVTETVLRFAWTHADRLNITGKAGAHDSATLLGRFQITVNRTGLKTSISPVVTVETSLGRQLRLDLSIDPMADPAVRRMGRAGTLYLLVVDAKTNETLESLTLEPTAGAYTFASSLDEGREVYLVAGNDPNNDLSLCGRLEVCGDYPPLGSGSATLKLTAPLSGIDFSIAPYDGFASASTAAAAGPPRRWLRPAPAPN